MAPLDVLVKLIFCPAQMVVALGVNDAVGGTVAEAEILISSKYVTLPQPLRN